MASCQLGLAEQTAGANLPSRALLIGLKLSLDHANNNFITDKPALVHNLLGFPT
jgi:hypothetical protein